jgi:hypothetical protein
MNFIHIVRIMETDQSSCQVFGTVPFRRVTSIDMSVLSLISIFSLCSKAEFTSIPARVLLWYDRSYPVIFRTEWFHSPVIACPIPSFQHNATFCAGYCTSFIFRVPATQCDETSHFLVHSLSDLRSSSLMHLPVPRLARNGDQNRTNRYITSFHPQRYQELDDGQIGALIIQNGHKSRPDEGIRAVIGQCFSFRTIPILQNVVNSLFGSLTMLPILWY